MCNLSQGVLDLGIQQGELNEALSVVERMMATFGYSFDDACHIAGYDGDKKDWLKSQIEKI